MIKQFYFLIFVFALLIVAGCSTDSGPVKFESDHAMKCYFFFIPDCPASENNLPKVTLLNDKFKDEVEFIGVLSSPEFDENVFDSTIRALNLDFEIVLDDSLKIAEKHGASVTPECFLYDADGNLIYSGAFDDYYKRVGVHNFRVKTPYLENAILDVIAGRKILQAKTKAVGCRISIDYFK